MASRTAIARKAKERELRRQAQMDEILRLLTKIDKQTATKRTRKPRAKTSEEAKSAFTPSGINVRTASEVEAQNG